MIPAFGPGCVDAAPVLVVAVRVRLPPPGRTGALAPDAGSTSVPPGGTPDGPHGGGVGDRKGRYPAAVIPVVRAGVGRRRIDLPFIPHPVVVRGRLAGRRRLLDSLSPVRPQLPQRAQPTGRIRGVSHGPTVGRQCVTRWSEQSRVDEIPLVDSALTRCAPGLRPARSPMARSPPGLPTVPSPDGAPLIQSRSAGGPAQWAGHERTGSVGYFGNMGWDGAAVHRR